jgi:hypothetical protein
MKFVNSPEYGAFGQKVLSITDSPYFHHLQSNPHPPSILGTAPITEFTTFYDVQLSYFDNLKEFVKRLGREKVDGYLGCAFGEVKEKIVRHEDVGNEGVEKGNAVVLLTGWESLEMHTRFEETGWFKENIGLLREGRGGVESVSFIMCWWCGKHANVYSLMFLSRRYRWTVLKILLFIQVLFEFRAWES